MPTVNCPQCGHQVSSQASACPQCGQPRSTPPQPSPHQQSKSGGGGGKIAIIIAVVVGLVALVGCGLVAAALAIPAFIQYMNSAKAAEADAILTQAGQEVRMEMEQSCEFPPELPATADPADCCGGEQCEYDPESLEAWRQAGIPIGVEQGYFAYEGELIDDDTYVLRAVADFGCESPDHTVEVEIERQVEEVESTGGGPRRPVESEPDVDDCEIVVHPTVTSNEFQ